MGIEDALRAFAAVEAAQATETALEDGALTVAVTGKTVEIGHCMRASRSRAAMPASDLG